MKRDRWSMALFIVLVFSLFLALVQAAEEAVAGEGEAPAEGGNATDPGVEEVHREAEDANAVLFPTFTLTIGIFVFFLLARYAQALPYTAVMFFIGILMGVGAELMNENTDHMNETIRMWTRIDSEVLLLVFLPGLIFKDAYGQNVHLFRISLNQCLIFAVPMVLAGTCLTALVAYHIFPYSWSFNLAMTFGSILSATDPVAVAALLEAVGAPPRLKVHIAGESLLNDGSAIVFYSIFSAKYLFELDPLIGEDVDWGRGIALFFRKSLGGVGIGVLFGGGMLFLLFLMSRRFNREENVVEVTATFAMAYLGFYVAEPVWLTSGVISTVTTGVLVKFFGRATINDAKLLDDFWTLVEHILNTVLFTLGGAVWGSVIVQGERGGVINGKDWGYLVLLYVLLHLIRLFLFIIAYPITKRIGLKTCWEETVFQVYGGLRGAVGIALALALDNEVTRFSAEGSVAADETEQLFFMVGGIAFLTLSINGTTAGPLLRRLGLAESTVSRQKIVKAYRTRYRADAIDDMVKLLTQERFRHINFALVSYHVPVLADLTRAQLMEAVDKHLETTPHEEYRKPHLDRILPYLKDQEDSLAPASRTAIITSAGGGGEEDDTLTDLQTVERKIQRELRARNRKKRVRRRSSSTIFAMLQTGEEPLSAQELRLLFISILRAAYEEQISHGELEDRTFMSIALEQSLHFAADAVSKGEPLKDWDFLTMTDTPIVKMAERVKDNPMVLGCLERLGGSRAREGLKSSAKQYKIERSMSFMAAHLWAQDFFEKEFQNVDRELSEGGKIVVAESKDQYRKAGIVLQQYKPEIVERVASHKFCSILLNNGFLYVGKLVESGLLKDAEAEHWVEEIEHSLEHVLSCDLARHPGELSTDEEVTKEQADGKERLSWQHLSVGDEISPADPTDSVGSIGKGRHEHDDFCM